MEMGRSVSKPLASRSAEDWAQEVGREPWCESLRTYGGGRGRGCLVGGPLEETGVGGDMMLATGKSQLGAVGQWPGIYTSLWSCQVPGSDGFMFVSLRQKAGVWFLTEQRLPR